MKLKIFWTLFVFVICMTFTTCQQNAYDSDTDDDVTTVKTAQLGNGNYTQTCFLLGDKTSDIENNLNVAKNYIMGWLNGFSQPLKAEMTKGFDQGLQAKFESLQNGSAFTPNQMSGFDLAITDLRDVCKPTINKIKDNINDLIAQSHFIRYYEALSNEVYKYGCGGSFGGIYGKNDTQEIYENTKQSVIDDWIGLHDIAGIDNFFDIKKDIEDNNCKTITSKMDNLIKQAATNMGNGIKAADLRSVVNLSFNINSLDAMHDYYGDIYDKHRGCSPVENETLSTFMINQDIEMTR